MGWESMPVDEVRRTGDVELCGFVEERNGRWASLTVFGSALDEHESEADAREHVLAEGLSALTERWTLFERATGRAEVACILEANPTQVTVARDYYALPGVPTLTITAAQLASGEWELRR